MAGLECDALSTCSTAPHEDMSLRNLLFTHLTPFNLRRTGEEDDRTDDHRTKLNLQAITSLLFLCRISSGAWLWFLHQVRLDKEVGKQHEQYYSVRE